MTTLAALCGLLVVGGLWLVVTSIKPVPIVAKAPKTRAKDPLLQRRLISAGAGAIVASVITRWPIAGVAGIVLGWFAAGMRGRKQRLIVERRIEAIALWTEMLRDAIGTSRGIEGVLVATASTAPIAIRPELQTMANRLQREPLDNVLDGLAADLDHPVGDLVVTALRLTSTTGGHQVRDVLNSLATAAYAEADSHRRIEVARERPRATMRYTAIIIGGFIGLMVVFSRSYLAPYDSAVGQLILAVVGVYWAIGFWWLKRMGRAEQVQRFLAPASQAQSQVQPKAVRT